MPTTYKFRGSLYAEFDYEDTDLSELVRDTVGMDDLYVFDGNCKPDMINKITLDYHRVTKIKPGQKPEDADWEFVTWDYTEHLIIDRATKTLEHIQNIGTGCKVSRKYEIEGGIESLLENFDAEDLFAHIEGNPDDVIDTPNETKDYTITIEYKKNLRRTITGSYDIKMGCQRISQILQKQYLTSFVSTVWEKSLTQRSTAKQNAASRNTSFAALLLMKVTRVIII